MQNSDVLLQQGVESQRTLNKILRIALSSEETLVSERVERAKKFEKHTFKRVTLQGKSLEIKGWPLPEGMRRCHIYRQCRSQG